MSVILRKTDPQGDAEALHRIYGDAESCRYLPDPHFATVEETVSKLSEWVNGAPQSDWAIVFEGDVVGRVTIYEKPNGVWEIGIMVTPKTRGRGIAVAGCQEAIDRVDAASKPRRIIADIDPDNAGSIALFERLGFKLEGVLRKEWVTHLGVRDTCLYALIDDDPRPWRSA
ncbi:GNAT family N-acetyltransferase [Parvularcula sp. ZS-1/3]|uniref:GNAT family N-acetyltransferase n=1 Tax=Parvularcula mediterranea TaxID=2732508 RepID=A0A7Y3RPB9_9PROT|nr:GNAT family N-acetyltransferase [Parvularcula mediterranea]NNU17325.1 GNAT family N-acetyltransferase [Parvularcula mediterranea]